MGNLRSGNEGIYQVWNYRRRDVSATKLEDVSNRARYNQRNAILNHYNDYIFPRTGVDPSIGGLDGLTPQFNNIDDDPVFGNLVHVELAYKQAPSTFQYVALAREYIRASDARGELLQITLHREIDRSLPDSHRDPVNFDFQKFYIALAREAQSSPEFAEQYGLPTDPAEFKGEAFWYNPARDERNWEEDKHQWPPDNRSTEITRKKGEPRPGRTLLDWDSEELKAFEKELDALEINLPKLDCFAAGTMIEMWDGPDKPIELIRPGDVVASFGQEGEKAPGVVHRNHVRTVPHVLDFHGLRVTPGHIFLCGQGPYEGQFRYLMDILVDDGTIVDSAGRSIRASTNFPVGSAEDQMVQALAVSPVPGPDGQTALECVDKGLIRAGARIQVGSGAYLTILEIIANENGVVRADDGMVDFGGELSPVFLECKALPKPQDYVLERSGLSLEELYARSAHWDAAELIH